MFNKNLDKTFFVIILLLCVFTGCLTHWIFYGYFEYKLMTGYSDYFQNSDTQFSESIIEKVREMNEKMEKYRYAFLEYFNCTLPFVNLSSHPSKVLYEGNPEYYEDIKNYTGVSIVCITWNHEQEKYSIFKKIFQIFPSFSDINERNTRWLLHKKFYRLTASEILCEWIISGDINFRYGYTYNYTCNTDIKKATIPTSIDPLMFNSRTLTVHDIGMSYPAHQFEMPNIYHALQIFNKSIISSVGELFIDEVQVKLHDCLKSPSSLPAPKLILNFTHHKEVFVISQHWGNFYFHRMIEDIPRLALFLEFLNKHPTIQILTTDNSEKLLEILEVLGLSRDRVITGWVRADIAYVPKPTSCGTPNMLEIQFLQRYFTQYIAKNLLDKTNYMTKKLLLIKRSRSRGFANYPLIEQKLNETSTRYGFEFVIFRDNPAPSLNETMIIFSLASVVVAPHGAGLANLVFGRPGTLVIEGVCNKPHVNLCYQRTAYALGMRWHGISSLSGCEGIVDVNGEEIDFILRSYLRLIPPEELSK